MDTYSVNSIGSDGQAGSNRQRALHNMTAYMYVHTTPLFCCFGGG